jgi:hypothetical protein
VISCSRGDHRAPSNCRGHRAGCNFFMCARGPKVDRLLVKMLVRLGPMGNESPKAQISGGKAASFANALRTTRSTCASQRILRSRRGDRSTCAVATDCPEAKNPLINPVTKPSQIILDKGLVLDKESRALTLLCRSTGKTSLSGIKHQPLTQPL